MNSSLDIKIPTLPQRTREGWGTRRRCNSTAKGAPTEHEADNKKRPAEAGLGCGSKHHYALGGGVLGVVCGVVVGGVLLGGLVDPGVVEFGFAPGAVVPGVGLLSGVVLGVVSGVDPFGVACGVGVVVVFGVVPGVVSFGFWFVDPGGGAAVSGVGAAVPGCAVPVWPVVPWPDIDPVWPEFDPA